MNFREFFYLKKSDRKVITFLLCLTIGVLGILFLLGNKRSSTLLNAADSSAIATERTRDIASYETSSGQYRLENGQKTELFPFDPNTADSLQLSRLGLAPYQIRNIYRYRAKGGVFRSPQSFAKVYGLTRKQYRDLEPYITIGEDYQPAFTMETIRNYERGRIEEQRKLHEAYEEYKKNDAYKPYKKYDRDTIRYPIKIKLGTHINLAYADTTMLKKVPGIGSGWAKTIVSYGERLGGYVAVGQLKEIEGFPVESLPFFEVRNAQTKRLNLNTLSLSQLRRHPYITFYMARQIVEYRRLKGRLSSLSQLRLLKEFPADIIERLQPYVCF